MYGGHFEVYTDNNPLTYILTTAKLDTPDKGGLLVWLTTILKFSIGVVNSMYKWMPYPEYHGKKYTSGSHGTFNCKDHVVVKTRNQCRYTRDVSTTKGQTKEYGDG